MARSAVRRLSDIYVVSRGVEIHDPESPDDPFRFTLVKLNHQDHQSCVRRADAARAVVLAAANDEDSDLYRAHLGVVLEQDDPRVLASWLVLDEVNKRHVALEAELAADDEWSKDGYLSGMREAWVESLNERFQLNPDDPDAKRVFDELTRFNVKVMERVTEEHEALVDMKADKPVDVLRSECVKHLLKRHSDEVWMETFRATSLFYMVRQPDSGLTPARMPRYFESIDEVFVTDQRILKQLVSEIEELEVDAIVGKDLSGNQGSSQTSEPTGTEDSTSFGQPNV